MRVISLGGVSIHLKTGFDTWQLILYNVLFILPFESYQCYAFIYFSTLLFIYIKNSHTKQNMSYDMPSEDSDQPAYLCSLTWVLPPALRIIWIFAINRAHSKGSSRAANAHLMWVFAWHILCLETHFFAQMLPMSSSGIRGPWLEKESKGR